MSLFQQFLQCFDGTSSAIVVFDQLLLCAGQVALEVDFTIVSCQGEFHGLVDEVLCCREANAQTSSVGLLRIRYGFFVFR